VKNIARIGRMRNANKILVGKTGRKRLFGIPRRIWKKDNIKID